MYFLVDKKKKVIIGWSAKCGCSHIKKIFWFLQNNKEDNKIHLSRDSSKLPNDIENYITILIIRNPYDRIVSGFLDKYKQNGGFRKLWKHEELTFTKFVDELILNTWTMIDLHHFTPQTTEDFDKNIILKSKELYIYDIASIDYKYIESIYNKIIPENLLLFRGGHENKNKTDIKSFYNEDIKTKVYNFYLNDFIFFKDFNYIL